jgi:hypothetical protein
MAATKYSTGGNGENRVTIASPSVRSVELPAGKNRYPVR